MPLHEAAHANIWGSARRARWGEDLIGMACAIPVGFSYKAHRTSHMCHHAFTNDPARDPDHYTSGSLAALPRKWFSVVVVFSLLPLFAFVPATLRLLPEQLRQSLLADADASDQREDLRTLLFWVTSHAALLAAVPLGIFWPALFLWYVPA